MEEKVAKAERIERTDQGAVHRVRQKTGKASSEARIAWTDFVQGAQIILRKGFWFHARDSGTVFVAGRRRIPKHRYAYDAEAILCW